jgi:FkbM family methyltransferase
MRSLTLPEWSDRRWLRSLRDTFENWPWAICQTASTAITKRPAVVFLRGLTRLTRFDRPRLFKLRGGGEIRTSDSQHLAGLLSSGWKVVKEESPFLLLEGPSSKVLVRPIDGESRDLCSLFEIQVRGDYGFDFTDQNIVDIGAGNGDSTVHFATRGARRVLAVEPNPRSADLARRNLELNSCLDRVTLIQAAVTSGASSVEMSFGPRYSTGHFESVAPPTTDQVRGIPINALLNDVGVVNLLKIDIEGTEYELLEAIAPKHWEKIAAVWMEFHQGLKTLPTMFESRGFTVTATADAEQGLLHASRDGSSSPVNSQSNG